ncbi:uncharacterized protein I206_104243 [Kwoniella pini CBS 10737]|uniref:Uncharacterized protein n=1 Tax=Kwoniella pini CBS 10737 TaxID=1296096 RepID=A0A1B9I2A6_9TREE|nr:uncharacterized protein I206_04179 [Kwoniella pini CBS 10737]OCF49657.1 hypothetical protein I206_04179 [Kwoniella pini CBS 10737]
MYQSNISRIQENQILIELEQLSYEVLLTSKRLLEPIQTIENQSPNSKSSFISCDNRSKFSRLLSLLPKNTLTRRKKYDNIDEKELLITSFRRNSNDSNKTLYIDSEIILKEISPLIRKLQKINSSLYIQRYSTNKEEEIHLFKKICEEIIKLLDSLKFNTIMNRFDNDDDDDEEDDDADEMRNLLISTLKKKIQNEINQLNSIYSLSSFNSFNNQNQNQNPFIIHSTSISNLKSQKNRRESQSIKIHKTPDISSCSFSDNSDQKYLQSSSNWAQNLIKIGSYQASLLFTNSPIIIRKLNHHYENDYQNQQGILKT